MFVWYTVTTMGDVHMQHILANGSAAFPQNGVDASTDTTQNHFEPSGAYDATTGDIYALWRETDASTQGQIGVYAQRIDSAEVRLPMVEVSTELAALLDAEMARRRAASSLALRPVNVQ